MTKDPTGELYEAHYARIEEQHKSDVAKADGKRDEATQKVNTEFERSPRQGADEQVRDQKLAGIDAQHTKEVKQADGARDVELRNLRQSEADFARELPPPPPPPPPAKSDEETLKR